MNHFVGFLWMSMLLPAPLATAAVPQVAEPGVCLECHSDMAELLQARHQHSAFRSGRCSECHNPHASRHASLLDADPRRLCGRCHEAVVAEASLAFTHAPAGNGRCVECHDPHAGKNRNQLRMTTPELCFACHPSAAAWPERPVVHAPIADGDCAVCHAAHGSGNPFLLNDPVPANCFGCHDRDNAFTAAHQDRDLGNADCSACHDPHAATRPGLLRANQHAPFAGGNCATCHGEPEPGAGFAIAQDIKPICLRCHRGVQADADTPHGGHLTPRDSCSDCHNPHASDGAALLAARQEVLCMRCHFEGEGRREKSFYITHDGMDCTECHVPHGSPEPMMLTTTGVDLCARCHESAHRVSHPVGADVIDPRTEESVTCLSCHQLHGADFDPYLPLDPAMDLCVICHKK